MIVDSTFLITLANLGKIELIEGAIIPEKVLEEILNEPAKSALLTLNFQKISPSIKSRKLSMTILGDTYESGDNDIVALLIDFSSSLIATDDRRIRNVCRSLGGKITGTLGILINSVKEKKITKNEALQLVKRLDKIGFRMSLELYKTVKQKIKRL